MISSLINSVFDPSFTFKIFLFALFDNSTVRTANCLPMNIRRCFSLSVALFWVYEAENSWNLINILFNCSNCIKTIDNKLVFYGTKRKLVLCNNKFIDRITGSFKYVKIVAKLNVQKVSLSMSETDLSKWLTSFPSEDDKNKNKEEDPNSKVIDGKSFL